MLARLVSWTWPPCRCRVTSGSIIGDLFSLWPFRVYGKGLAFIIICVQSGNKTWLVSEWLALMHYSTQIKRGRRFSQLRDGWEWCLGFLSNLFDSLINPHSLTHSLWLFYTLPWHHGHMDGKTPGQTGALSGGVKQGVEQLRWYTADGRRGGQAAINPSCSQPTLKKQGLIKFSFRLPRSPPLFPLLSFSNARAEINPCRLSVGPGWWHLQSRPKIAATLICETMNDTNAPWRWDDGRPDAKKKKKEERLLRALCVKALQGRTKINLLIQGSCSWKEDKGGGGSWGVLNFCSYRVFFLWIDPAVTELVMTTAPSSTERHAFVFRSLMESDSPPPPFLSHAVSLLCIWHLLAVHYFTFNQSGDDTLSVLSFCLRTSTAGNFQFQGWHPISQVVITRDRVYSPSVLIYYLLPVQEASPPPHENPIIMGVTQPDTAP